MNINRIMNINKSYILDRMVRDKLLTANWNNLERKSMNGKEPLILLENSLNSVVLVKLRGSRQIRGKLTGFDSHMNLILSDSDEIDPEGKTISRGRIVVRGDNVIIIAPAPR